MTHFGGYDNTITFTTEASGGADSTSGYFKLVGSESQGWAAGGWGDGPYIDFTGYDTLVFWAKVPGTPTVGKICCDTGEIRPDQSAQNIWRRCWGTNYNEA